MLIGSLKGLLTDTFELENEADDLPWLAKRIICTVLGALIGPFEIPIMIVIAITRFSHY